MKTAHCRVLHSFIAADGQWRNGPTCDLPEGEARSLEARGYVDILTVDGNPEVWGACCSEHQA